MATVGKGTADELKASDGYCSDDERVMRIVEYTDMGGKVAYGIEYGHEIGRYEASPFVRSPRVYWEAKDAE